MRNIPRLSKEQINKMQLDDKQYAIKLVRLYQKIININTKYLLNMKKLQNDTQY